MEYEEALKKFEETGECEWCGGEGEICENAGHSNEYFTRCPVCNLPKEEDPDEAFENERDNNLSFSRESVGSLSVK